MKKLISLITLSVMLLSLASCKVDTNISPNKQQEKTQTEVPATSPTVENANKASEELTENIEVKDTVTSEIDDDFKKASYDLYTKLFNKVITSKRNENALISPISIHAALAMTANGANDGTLKEMEKLLADGSSIQKLNEYLGGFLKDVSSEQDAKLSIANSVWFRDDKNQLSVLDSFLESCKSYYDAEVYKEPFDSGTVKNINDWVKKSTDGMIEKIIEKIDAETMLYIINALSFDAEWEKVYNKSAIREGEFNNNKGAIETATMMHSKENIYLECEDAIGFIKPYKGGKYSFATILHTDPEIDVYGFAQTLDGQKLSDILNSKKTAHVSATMPKFSYEFETELNDILENLGMKTAFDAQRADFSKMGISSLGNLFISKVLHKTFITVDEKGTKAGAVTSVEMNAESAPAEIKYVNLDRPFIYMIIDNDTNLPVFMGVLTTTK